MVGFLAMKRFFLSVLFLVAGAVHLAAVSWGASGVGPAKAQIASRSFPKQPRETRSRKPRDESDRKSLSKGAGRTSRATSRKAAENPSSGRRIRQAESSQGTAGEKGEGKSFRQNQGQKKGKIGEGVGSVQIKETGAREGDAGKGAIGHEAGGDAAAAGAKERLESLKRAKIKRIVEVSLKGSLNEKKKSVVMKALQEATAETLLVVRLSTSGGKPAVVDALAAALLKTPAHTVAFVERRAQGEAALVAMACDIVAMGAKARLGALATDQYGAASLSQESRAGHVALYAKAARDNGRPHGTVMALVDAKRELKVHSEVLNSVEEWEKEGLRGRRKGVFLWVGPTAGEKLGLTAVAVAGGDVRKALGFGHLPAVRDGVRMAPKSATESGDPLNEVKIPRAKPVDPMKLVKGVRKIYVLKISGTIDMGLAPFVKRVVKNRKSNELVVLNIDTFGGRVDSAVAIRDSLLKSKASTIAFVNRRAISAGALISLACDLIVMTSGGSLGAATPVQISGGKMKPTDEKVVSYMRKEMKSTAEAKGRRGDLAEAMVDRDMDVTGLPHVLKESISGLKKGKLLTLTTEEAVALGMADMKAESLDALFKKLEIDDVPVKKVGINWAEEIARLLTNPMVAGILLSLGMLGIMVELFTPGIGIPGALGVACLLLFFLGHFVAGLAGWEHILVFGAGIVLLAVELFVTPGFGVLGALGGVAILGSLVMALMGSKNVDFDTALALGYLTRAVAITVGSLLVAALLAFAAVRYLPSTGFLNKLVLQLPEKKKSGKLYLGRGGDEGDDEGDGGASGGASGIDDLDAGAKGLAFTILRPAGKVRFGKKNFSAVAHGEYIEKGDEVELVRHEAGRLVVRRWEHSAEGGESGDGGDEHGGVNGDGGNEHGEHGEKSGDGGDEHGEHGEKSGDGGDEHGGVNGDGGNEHGEHGEKSGDGGNEHGEHGVGASGKMGKSDERSGKGQEK